MKKKSIYIIITVLFCIVTYIAGIKCTESTIAPNYIPLNQCIPLEDVTSYYIVNGR